MEEKFHLSQRCMAEALGTGLLVLRQRLLTPPHREQDDRCDPCTENPKDPAILSRTSLPVREVTSSSRTRFANCRLARSLCGATERSCMCSAGDSRPRLI